MSCLTVKSDEVFQHQKMAPTQQRPASASFATQSRVRRVGSFASSNNSSGRQSEIIRAPVRLVFKHEKLEKLATKNLKSRTVKVDLSITVNTFVRELLEAMHAKRYLNQSQVQVAFLGQSVTFPVYFSGNDCMQRVFHKISSIE